MSGAWSRLAPALAWLLVIQPPSPRTRRLFMLAVFLLALAAQSPHLYRSLAADHRPAAVARRYREAARDNDVAAVTRAAPLTTWAQAGRWVTTAEWIDLDGGGPFWRPVVSALWWFEYRAFGRDVILYNLVTVLLIALAAACLAGGMSVLSGSLPAATLTAGLLLWKVTGPLAGILAWFPAQTDVLAGALLAAAWYALLLGEKCATGTRQVSPSVPVPAFRSAGWLFAASLLAYIAAVGAKEAALPFVLVPLVLLGASEKRRAWPWLAAFGAVALALLALRTLTLGGAGHFLVTAGPGHLARRALIMLAGPWLDNEIIGWHSVAVVLLAGAIVLVATCPSLLERRPVWYGLLVGVPAALVGAAALTPEGPLVLLDPSPWRGLPRGLVFVLAALLMWRQRPREFGVLVALLLACSVQLIVVRDWFRPHYFYLPALAWSALDGLALLSLAGWVRGRVTPRRPVVGQ